MTFDTKDKDIGRRDVDIGLELKARSERAASAAGDAEP
jgi:hypothetical protein